VPDVAYHVTKWERGFTRVINVQGGDHHSTITRVRAGLQAMEMGIPKGYPDYVLHKMVTVMRGGEEVKISKRAGDYVTIRELVDEVAATRSATFSFRARVTASSSSTSISRARNPTRTLCTTSSMRHARMCSVLRQAGIVVAEAPGLLADADLSPLTSPYEQALLRRLADFPTELAAAARDLAPHQITFYLKDLAQEFHSY